MPRAAASRQSHCRLRSSLLSVRDPPLPAEPSRCVGLTPSQRVPLLAVRRYQRGPPPLREIRHAEKHRQNCTTMDDIRARSTPRPRFDNALCRTLGLYRARARSNARSTSRRTSGTGAEVKENARRNASSSPRSGLLRTALGPTRQRAIGHEPGNCSERTTPEGFTRRAQPFAIDRSSCSSSKLFLAAEMAFPVEGARTICSRLACVGTQSSFSRATEESADDLRRIRPGAGARRSTIKSRPRPGAQLSSTCSTEEAVAVTAIGNQRFTVSPQIGERAPVCRHEIASHGYSL